MNGEDWLKDPLMTISSGSFDYLRANEPHTESRDPWTSFHFNTRLKLNGADFFFRQLRSSICRPDWLGLPQLAYNFRQWYLDAFFFELISAYESVIQELNAIFNCGGKMTDHDLISKVKQRIPQDLVTIINEEHGKDWFKKLRWYRNSVSHRGRTPSDDMTAGSGDRPWHFDEYEVYIYYFDEQADQWKQERIEVCGDYFSKMLDHINAIWKKIKEHCLIEPMQTLLE